MRLGIFGGTFDPPHLGHLHLAEKALIQFKLNCILWVLTPIPPHKNESSILDVKHRIDMVSAVIVQDHRFTLSRIDINRPPPHYAVDTLSLLKKENPDDELFYLIGGDSLGNLPLWHKPLEVVAHCTKLGVLRRPGERIDLNSLNLLIPGILEKIIFIDSQRVKVSATDIRNRIYNDEPYKHLIPKSVNEIITARDLYKT